VYYILLSLSLEVYQQIVFGYIGIVGGEVSYNIATQTQTKKIT